VTLAHVVEAAHTVARAAVIAGGIYGGNEAEADYE